MTNCNFLSDLNRLRKSSSESIDNVEKFDRFKEYMHVTRMVEEDLKNILRKVNEVNKKSLVLLCGSAGDGKSHLLSYLKNSDEEKLIEGYTIYNDATESSAPSKTAIETLNELLDEFKDTNLEIPGKNVILAINLGVLSNFIESEYGENYQELRRYVEENNILTNMVNHKGYSSMSNFQHVSFSDYHMFSLTEKGIHAGYIEEILSKVFRASEENVFYLSYENNCNGCPLAQKCPVKKNYEFLENEKVQNYVAELLVKSAIKDKMILTTREILNFIYDMLVAQDFNYTDLQKLSVDNAQYLKVFMQQITPALLFDSKDVTALMNVMGKYDPLLFRNEYSDDDAIDYYVSSNVTGVIKEAFAGIQYSDVITSEEMLERINSDKDLKSSMYNLLIRVKDMMNEQSEDEKYRRFLKDLYMYNAGEGNKLGSLYEMVQKSVEQWCGSDGDGNLRLQENNARFTLYETVEFTPNISHIPEKNQEDEIHRFVPSIVVAFEGGNGELIKLDIDYELYSLIYRLNQGYIQTANDRNNHADFISFIDRILQTGSLDKEIIVLSENKEKAMIKKGMFGYKFKVVK